MLVIAILPYPHFLNNILSVSSGNGGMLHSDAWTTTTMNNQDWTTDKAMALIEGQLYGIRDDAYLESEIENKIQKRGGSKTTSPWQQLLNVSVVDNGAYKNV